MGRGRGRKHPWAGPRPAPGQANLAGVGLGQDAPPHPDAHDLSRLRPGPAGSVSFEAEQRTAGMDENPQEFAADSPRLARERIGPASGKLLNRAYLELERR